MKGRYDEMQTAALRGMMELMNLLEGNMAFTTKYGVCVCFEVGEWPEPQEGPTEGQGTSYELKFCLQTRTNFGKETRLSVTGRIESWRIRKKSQEYEQVVQIDLEVLDQRKWVFRCQFSLRAHRVGCGLNFVQASLRPSLKAHNR